MDITAYRKTYFACCKALALDDDMRHDFNFAMVGKYSTGDFTVSDWRAVVAELQRRSGQDTAPGRPRIKGGSLYSEVRDTASGNRHPASGSMITPAQLEYLTALAGQIPWKVSSAAYIRSRLPPLRKANWDGQLPTLFKSEANRFINTFQAMIRGAQKGTADATAQ